MTIRIAELLSSDYILKNNKNCSKPTEKIELFILLTFEEKPKIICSMTLPTW